MGKTILLADKSITIQKIVELTFADDNYAIRSVSDGTSALDALSQVRPDLILADISLPVKNGYDVCLTLRTDPSYAEFSQIPVILLAGIYETMDEERLKQVEQRVREVQANDFLSKPFDPQVLISKVKQYMEGAKSEAETGFSFASTSFAAVEPDPNANLFADPPTGDYGNAEPYDEEKTMVLPQSPFAAGNLFSSAQPFAQDAGGNGHSQHRPPVNVENIKPVDEPVFDADDMEENVEEQVTELADESTFAAETTSDVDDTGKIFSPAQEVESPWGESATSQPPVIVAPEDPFGLEEPAQRQWTAASSDEDSPFGVPEPPQFPVEPVDASEAEPPHFEAEATASEDLDVAEDLESSAEPTEDFDDTWPGVNLESGTQPVEELFASETSDSYSNGESTEAVEAELTEEEEELAAVDSEIIEPANETIVISDEFIDRVVEKVLSRLSERVVSEIVWQVVPDLAEKMIRRELEKLHAGKE